MSRPARSRRPFGLLARVDEMLVRRVQRRRPCDTFTRRLPWVCSFWARCSQAATSRSSTVSSDGCQDCARVPSSSFAASSSATFRASSVVAKRRSYGFASPDRSGPFVPAMRCGHTAWASTTHRRSKSYPRRSPARASNEAAGSRSQRQRIDQFPFRCPALASHRCRRHPTACCRPGHPRAAPGFFPYRCRAFSERDSCQSIVDIAVSSTQLGSRTEW
jgi:hypothetical protein